MGGMGVLARYGRYLIAAIPIAAGAGGCRGQVNAKEITEHISFQPAGATYYVGYTGTSFNNQIPTGKKVLVTRAAIASSTGEFAWLASVTGTAGKQPVSYPVGPTGGSAIARRSST
jgi:hypothetical protein